jgi:DNA invertase Pin-like site-specific DNA recombinase
MKTTKTAANTRQGIIWGRYSSDQQKDGDSQDRQDRLNQAAAKQYGIEIVGNYFDKAASVKDGATPLFKKIIDTLPKGVGVICENLDRISRGHPWLQKAYIYEIILNNHFIITSQDGIEYNSDTINTIGTVAIGDLNTNLSNAENVKRTKRVREEKAKAVELARQGKAAPLGKWLSAHIKYNPETKCYDIREDRRKVIEKIYTDYANGKGVVAITKELNEAKTPTFRGKGKIGEWQRTTVFTLLRYEGVIGVFNYCGERIVKAWQPAISEKLFYSVQAILETNKQRHGKYSSNNVNNIFRGISKCPHCNSNIRTTKDGYMACAGYQQGRCKIKNMIKFREMEYEFTKWLVPMAKDALLGTDETKADIDALQVKIGGIDKRIEETLELLDSGLAPIQVKARIIKLEDEKTTIENEINTAKTKQVSHADLPANLKLLDSLIDGVLDNQDARRKVADIVPTMVKRVEIDIADKIMPSFTAYLINGEKMKWQYEIDEFNMTHYKTIEGRYKIIK